MKKRLILIFIGVVIFIVIKQAQNNFLLKNDNLFKGKKGDYNFSLKHDGLERKYLVHVPSNYKKGSKVPLVLVFHGGGSNAENAPYFFGLNEKSNKEGFIVVYPEGTGKKILGKTFASWNAGKCCGDASKNNVDDVGFIRTLIKKLKNDFSIDEKRIY